MKKLMKVLIWPIFLLPAVHLLLSWPSIPTRVPLHFGINGEADRFGNKTELITVTAWLTVLNIVVYLLVSNIYRIDPKKYADANRDRLRGIATAVAIFLSFILIFLNYSSQTGSLNIGMPAILSGTGLLFAVIGNYMPNLKPNYFAGIRLPWTLESEDNWKKTHALAGKLWFGGGLLLALICLVTPPAAASIVFFILLSIMIIIPCIYSYRYYRHHKSAG